MQRFSMTSVQMTVLATIILVFTPALHAGDSVWIKRNG